jgi:hypothetical protein
MMLDRRGALSEAIRARAEARRIAGEPPRVDVVFTIVSSNYAAQAKVLMDSVAASNPDLVRVIVAADNASQDEFADHQVVFAQDTSAPWRAMAAYYDALEYNTAIKPSCFKHLFDQSEAVERVIYLDPDIVVFEPLTPVLGALEQADIALTPHMTTPLGMDGRTPDDHAILRSGVYNLGFLGLRRSADQAAFVDWWADRCRFDCRVAFEDGLFTDQRWVDLAPGFFARPAILRHPGLNLGYWNLPARRLAMHNGKWLADDLPLVFFHYSGFDPSTPGALSKHQNRLEVVGGSPLARLLAHCASALIQAGHRVSRDRPYRFAKVAGTRSFTGLMRRTILEASRLGLAPAEAGADENLSAWLDAASPASAAAGRGGMTRIVERLWNETPDAADRFQLDTDEGRAAWLRHVEINGDKQGLDATALAAFRALWSGDAPPPPPSADDAESQWPAACVAFWERDPTTRALFPAPSAANRLEMLAYCLGPAALEGRFDPRTLPDDLGLDLEGRLAVARRAVTLSTPFLDPRFRAADPLAQLLGGLFGVAHRAGWSPGLVDTLRAEAGPLEDGGMFDVPGLLRRIVLSRVDLQKAFPSRGPLPLRLCNWFVRLGLAEYGCVFAALPAATRNNFAIRLVKLRPSIP